MRLLEVAASRGSIGLAASFCVRLRGGVAMATVPWVTAAALRRSVQEATAGAASDAQQAPPQAAAAPSTGRSIGTLVVIVAAIVLAAVLAGVLARACGGRHVEPSGDRDVEGWVERRCRTCLDSGLPTPGASKTSEAK